MARIKGWRGNIFLLPDGSKAAQIVLRKVRGVYIATIHTPAGRFAGYASTSKAEVERWVAYHKKLISKKVYG